MLALWTRARHYLGLDLKARELPLNFDFPGISARLKTSHGSSANLMRKLNQSKEAPADYFGELLAVIKHLNRCAMKPRQRLALTRDVLNLFYPVALAQLARHAKTGGVPEEEERKLVLNRLVEIARILIVSCQILFDGYYRGSNFKYARARKVVRECVSRIFELMLLKQRAKALRYQLLDEQDWRVVNTIFYVMNIHEDVESAFPTLQELSPRGRKRNSVSLREQFALLHIVDKFDMLRWPAHLQWIIGNYAASVENAVAVRMTGDGVPAPHELIAYCYGGQAASSLALKNPPGPALLLDWRKLGEAIRKDCMALTESKKNRNVAAMPARFARFQEIDHLVISSQLVRGLGNAADDDGSETGTDVDDLRIFVGFSEVFDLLLHKQGEFASESRLADILAKRSAQIAEDHLATEKSVWSLLFQNERTLRLSTQETSLTTRMNLGSLLAYGVGENINRPSLAVVERIFRPSNKKVVIDLRSIAHYAEQVLMTVNAATQATGRRHGKAALLLYDRINMGGWGLMFQPRDILPGIDQIAIHRNHQEIPIGLGSWRNVTHDFHLYATSLTSARLGISGEPRYAAAPATAHH